MNFSVGIIGLPNVGKSTLFKALTKQAVDISNYPFCTIDPNVGVVAVPDEHLKAIAKIIKPKKITPTVIEFVDIAGLVKNAHQGEGLGNQFLARIREVDAICQVVRVFINEKITHTEGQPNPQRDIEIVNTELIMKDLETVNKRLEKTEKQAKSADKKSLQELAALNELKKILEQGKLIKELLGSPTPKNLGVGLLKELPKELGLLTAKPIIYVFNVSGNVRHPVSNISFDLKLESELSELSQEEQRELELPSSQLDRLIKACYQILHLITFYTITGGQETRAWTLKNGLKVPRAGGIVHSDFEEKFIRAEVINYQDLIKFAEEQKVYPVPTRSVWFGAREKGLVQTQGKEYVVRDRDVVEFKI